MRRFPFLLPLAWWPIRDAHPTLDAVATGLPVGAVALAALASARRAWALAASSLAVGALATVEPWRTARPTGRRFDPRDSGSPVLRLAFGNALFTNSRVKECADDLVSSHPDVVAAVEVTAALHDELRQRYPHGMRGGGPRTTESQAIYAVWPIEGAPLRDAPYTVRGVRAIVRPPDRSAFVIYAVHLQRPFFDVTWLEHRQLVDWIATRAEQETLPTIVTGDFNLSDRAWGYRRLTRTMIDAARARSMGPTYRSLRPFALRIDYVVTTKQWRASDARRIELRGSDHRGLAIDLLCD